jgi:hypothetical protein
MPVARKPYRGFKITEYLMSCIRFYRVLRRGKAIQFDKIFFILNQ